MDVSAQCVSSRRTRRNVAREKWRERVRLADASDAPLFRRVAGVGVVIAAHQHEIDAGVRRAPLQERRVERGDAAGLRMQKITEDDESARAGPRAQPRETREIGGGGAAWQRHAAGTECGRLAEMNVGDEQCSLPRPKERALGEQHDALAGDHGRERAWRVVAGEAGSADAIVERQKHCGCQGECAAADAGFARAPRLRPSIALARSPAHNRRANCS
jgi:hypothetical protein